MQETAETSLQEDPNQSYVLGPLPNGMPPKYLGIVDDCPKEISRYFFSRDF